MSKKCIMIKCLHILKLCCLLDSIICTHYLIYVVVSGFMFICVFLYLSLCSLTSEISKSVSLFSKKVGKKERWMYFIKIKFITKTTYSFWLVKWLAFLLLGERFMVQSLYTSNIYGVDPVS